MEVTEKNFYFSDSAVKFSTTKDDSGATLFSRGSRLCFLACFREGLFERRMSFSLAFSVRLNVACFITLVYCFNELGEKKDFKHYSYDQQYIGANT